MIKSIFDEDENTDTGKPAKEESRSRAHVLGIFGEEAEVGTSSAETSAGPFDTAGIEMPFPVRGQSTEPAGSHPVEEVAEPARSTLAGSDEPEPAIPSAGPPPPLAEFTPPTTGETIRMTGLAWSAGIMLFGSIAFLTVIGWFADLLIGSSPWGVVAGVVLGSIIGFVQLFRINAEILRITNRKKRPATSASLSLIAAEPDPPALAEAEKDTRPDIGDNSPPRD